MAGYLLTADAVVTCAHGGRVQPTMFNPRVRVMGQPTVTMAAGFAVAGCPSPPPPAGIGPCVFAHWTAGAARLMSNGQPLLLANGLAIGVPSGAPLKTVTAQTRVVGI